VRVDGTHVPSIRGTKDRLSARSRRQPVRGIGAAKCQGHLQWPLADRTPHLLETIRPGVFAAGDVRAGASNRVASAVGDGAMVVRFVHDVLAG
jgi:NADPH-dependent glutamate synthase beta subunit-like oxidoreductase